MLFGYLDESQQSRTVLENVRRCLAYCAAGPSTTALELVQAPDLRPQEPRQTSVGGGYPKSDM